MTKAVINLHWLIGLVNSIGKTGVLNQLENSLSCDSHALGIFEKRILFCNVINSVFVYSSIFFNVLPTFTTLTSANTGMEEGRIPDSAISASSTFDQHSVGPHIGRVS